jgi:mannosyltransferase PIG-V
VLVETSPKFEITVRRRVLLPVASSLSLRSLASAMNPETAEEPIRAVRHGAAERARESAVALRAPAWWVRLRADPLRMTAVRESWRALWRSRLLVWVAGAGTVLAFGSGPVRHALNPPGLTRGLGSLGDALAAPAARWDAAWYLVIAHFGYRPDFGAFTASRTAFFPLYPLLVRAGSALGAPLVIAGVGISLAAFAPALYGIHRLTTLELGRAARTPDARGRVGEAARLAVVLTAFAPMALYFSAVYTESLFLALSVGVFWSARHGRWAWAGALGALAAATRSTGIVLVLPALMIYLYGPREDRLADFARRTGSRLRPRYRPRRELAWLGLMPAGALAYCLFLGLAGGDAFAPFHSQGSWGRHFAGPYLGIWDGVKAGVQGLRQLLSMQRAHVFFPDAGGSPFVSAGHNLMLLAFLLAAIPMLVGALRRLPLAYGVYAIAALALPLSYPVGSQPLMSLPRFLVVLFPLAIACAAWLSERPRLQRPALAGSALLLAFFTAQFATWHWVA